MLDVDKQALGQVFSRHFSFPLLIITIPPMPHTHLTSGLVLETHMKQQSHGTKFHVHPTTMERSPRTKQLSNLNYNTAV